MSNFHPTIGGLLVEVLKIQSQDAKGFETDEECTMQLAGNVYMMLQIAIPLFVGLKFFLVAWALLELGGLVHH